MFAMRSGTLLSDKMFVLFASRGSFDFIQHALYASISTYLYEKFFNALIYRGRYFTLVLSEQYDSQIMYFPN